jgi:Aromatic acid exporter family member 1
VLPRVRARLSGLFRRGRVPGLRTGKTVLAAVLAFVLAEALHTSSSPVLAPLTALLVVQLTMYETLAHGRERIVSVVAGVLLAVGFAGVTGLTWWSLGLVVAVSLVAGRLLRLGPHLLEVPISAMLVLAVGGAESAALGRVVETLVGAAVGVAVNLLIAPPLYVQPAGDAIAELAERLAGFSTELADALRGQWSRDVASELLGSARELNQEVARADRHLARAEESARLNPRGRPARAVEPRLRGTLTALEHAQVGLRQLARTLLDRTFFVPEEEAGRAWSAAAREALAEVLQLLGAALEQAGGVGTGSDPTPADVEDQLTALLDGRERLAAALLVDPRADPAAWGQHGALLDAVDRLRVEAGTALRPPAVSWGPPLAGRPRQAVRRALRRRRDRSD